MTRYNKLQYYLQIEHGLGLLIFKFPGLQCRREVQELFSRITENTKTLFRSIESDQDVTDFVEQTLISDLCTSVPCRRRVSGGLLTARLLKWSLSMVDFQESLLLMNMVHTILTEYSSINRSEDHRVFVGPWRCLLVP